MIRAHNLNRAFPQGLLLLAVAGAGPLVLDRLHLQIQQAGQLAGEGLPALFVAVPHFPDGFKVRHVADNTGHFIQPGPFTAMMTAVARDDLITLAVLFRADGGGGHNAMLLDRPHQIIHRLIVLHLVGMLPERMERMELGQFQIDNLALLNRAGRLGWRGRQVDLRDRGRRRFNGRGLAFWGRFRRGHPAGALFRGFLFTLGHFVSRGRLGLGAGRLVPLGWAACAGLGCLFRFWRLWLRLFLWRTAPALFRLFRFNGGSLAALIIITPHIRQVDDLTRRSRAALAHTGERHLFGLFRRGRCARPLRGRGLRELFSLRALVQCFICHSLTSFFVA